MTTMNLDKILDETIPSEIMRQYLKGISNNLTERQIAQIICGAPVPIFKKSQLLQELAINNNCGIYAGQLQIITDAIESLTLKPDELFCLCGYCNENDERVQFESMPVHDYKKALSYVSQDDLADNVWYVLEKWKLDDELNYGQTLSYIIIGNEICYFYHLFFDNKGKAENFCASSVNLNLPVPFAVGDIIKVDCTPFAPVQNILITEIGDNKDCCCVQGTSIDTNGNLVSGALKHGTCLYDGSHNIISPLYHAEKATDLSQVDKKLKEEKNKLRDE
jgi:hypothetical protein